MEAKAIIDEIREYIDFCNMPLKRRLMLTKAVDKLEELLAENEQLRNKLTCSNEKCDQYHERIRAEE